MKGVSFLALRNLQNLSSQVLWAIQGSLLPPYCVKERGRRDLLEEELRDIKLMIELCICKGGPKRKGLKESGQNRYGRP